MLPHPVKEHERRAMLEGLFEMGNDTIVFTSTHLDVNSQETRAEQIKFITGHFKNYKYPEFWEVISTRVITPRQYVVWIAGLLQATMILECRHGNL